MPLTTTTGANAIREAYAPGFDEAVFRNNSLMSLFSWQDAEGDTAFRWKLNSSPNDSVQIFTEGLPQPAAGNQSYVNAYVSWTYFRVMLQITGHARDALKSRWINAIEEEAILGRADLVDLITTSFMGSTYGLELAIDDTTDYAGITRSGAAYFQSTETAHSAALTTDALIDLQETIRNAEKGGKPAIILSNLNQESNIYRLGGPHLITNMNPGDKTPSLLNNRVAGCDVVSVPDFTTTVVMMLDMRPSNWAPRIIRPFSVKEMAPAGDSDIYQFSWGGTLVCKMPKFQGKLTGVTA
jgi:hypothetical protein